MDIQVTNSGGNYIVSLPQLKTITTTVKKLAYIIDEDDDEKIITSRVYETKEEANKAKELIESLFAQYRERSYYDVLIDVKYNPNYFNEYTIHIFTQHKGDGMDEDDWHECELSSGQVELNLSKALNYALPKIDWPAITEEVSIQMGIQVQGDFDEDEDWDKVGSIKYKAEYSAEFEG